MSPRSLNTWTTKLIVWCPCHADHFWQFSPKSVHSFSKYRVQKFGDRRTDGQTDGRTDRRTGKKTDRRTDRRTDGPVRRQTDGRTNGRRDRRTGNKHCASGWSRLAQAWYRCTVLCTRRWSLYSPWACAGYTGEIFAFSHSIAQASNDLLVCWVLLRPKFVTNNIAFML